jgi:hypothetical protein
MKDEQAARREQAAQRFQVLVDALGIDFAKLARSIGLDRPDTLYLVKNAKGYPSFDTIAKILDVYPQVDANFLFGKSDQPLKPEPPSQNAIPEDEMEAFVAFRKVLAKHAGN